MNCKEDIKPLEQRLDLPPGMAVIKRNFVLDYLAQGIVCGTVGALMIGNVATQELKRAICFVAGYECTWVEHEDSSFGHYEVAGKRTPGNEEEW